MVFTSMIYKNICIDGECAEEDCGRRICQLTFAAHQLLIKKHGWIPAKSSFNDSNELSYPALYKDSSGRQWEGSSGHPQVDSGLGFSCDEGILDLVIALNKGPIQTLGSCQERKEGFYVPRAWVCFIAKNPIELLQFCLDLAKKSMELYDCPDVEIYDCQIKSHTYKLLQEPFSATISVPLPNMGLLIAAISAVMPDKEASWAGRQ